MARRQRGAGRKLRAISGLSTGKVRQGRVNTLGLARWKSSRGFWAAEVVSSGVAPGSGMIEGRGDTGLV